MDVTIIGAGNMARGIGTRLVAGGHQVRIVDRDPAEAEALAENLGTKAKAAPLDQALGNSVVVLAMTFAAAQDFAKANAAQLAGKIVVEISNPLNASYDGLATAPGTSAAEEIARLLPESRVVKAFNTTFAGTLVAGEVAGQPLDVLVAGDDAEAKQMVIKLAEDGKLRGIDAGPLERARQLEGLGFLGIVLQMPLNLGFQSAWKLIA